MQSGKRWFVCLLLLASYALAVLWVSFGLLKPDVAEAEGCPLRDAEPLLRLASGMAHFFRSKNVTAHPWVLGLVSAMRYGGNTISFAGRDHTMDHDVDMRVVTEKGLKKEEKSLLLQNLERALAPNHYMVISYPEGMRPWPNGPKLSANPTMLVLGGSTDMGWVQATELFPRMLYMKHQRAKLDAESWYQWAWSAMAEYGTFALAKALGLLLAPFWAHIMVVDFHFDTFDRFLAAGSNLTNRSVLWAGQEWPFPAGLELEMRRRTTSYIGGQQHGESQIRDAVQKYCDLYLPRGLWLDDVQPSESVDEVTRFCGRRLEMAGYLSFHEHCEPGRKPPNEAFKPNRTKRNSTLNNTEMLKLWLQHPNHPFAQLMQQMERGQEQAGALRGSGTQGL